MIDVVVVGAGIVGTAIAEKLRSEGREVLLLDREGPGEGCSKGHAGHFATDIVLPLANPETLLSVPKMLLDPLGPLALRWSYLPKMLPWLSRFVLAARPSAVKASATALRALNGSSISSYDALLQRTKLQDKMIKSGALTVYNSDKGREQHRKTVALLRDYGINLEEISGDEVRELEPSLADTLAGGLYFPDTAHTGDPQGLVCGLFDFFMASGGQYRQCEVNAIREEAEGVLLTTDTGAIRANKVVIAAGAWSKTLASGLGYRVPLDTERGYHLMLPKPGVELTRPVVSHELSFVMTPMDAGLCLAGTVELAGLSMAPNWRRADILFERSKALLPGGESEGAKRWMGFRPSLPDSLPVIGQAPRHRQVYFAFGHQHLGFTQAALTAELIADQLSERTPSVDLNPYRVDRF